MHNHNGILVFGYNPWGNKYSGENSIYSEVENGNAYFTEDWNSPLQDEVLALFEGLGDQINGNYQLGYKLLSKSLAANFVPYRSPRQDKLPAKKQCENFAKQLWNDIFEQIEFFTLMISIGNAKPQASYTSPYKFLKNHLNCRDCEIKEEREEPIRGTYSLKSIEVVRDGQKSLLVGFPHLGQMGQFLRNNKHSKLTNEILRRMSKFFK